VCLCWYGLPVPSHKIDTTVVVVLLVLTFHRLLFSRGSMELMMTLLASALILLTLSKSTSSFAGYSNLPYNLPRLSVAHQTSRLEIPDIERARDCAENFGVCSLDEIEEIKKGTVRRSIQCVYVSSLYYLLQLLKCLFV
jgi:hypothetical protein